MKVTITVLKPRTVRCAVCGLLRAEESSRDALLYAFLCPPCRRSLAGAGETIAEVIEWAATRVRRFERRRQKAEKRAPVYCSATSAHGERCSRFVRAGNDLCGIHARRQADREGRS